ncbi:HAD family phosphatase [Bacillus sp. T3]|uniref:HAD family hydrolase n=1 Tax=Bacillus sp. T3 TaxID=467262 RepID=UPI002981BF4B|nr:HAD family phosphatase [Bacillus sp. T3]
MIKNIVFDLGNVLLNWNPEVYLQQRNIEVDKIPEVYKEIFQSKEWDLLDRGLITEDEAKDIIIKRSHNNGHLIRLAFENWYELFTPIEDTVDILKSVKNAGYKAYFLSVFHLLAFENVTKRYAFFEHFDGGVASYEAKMVKPEEGIYKQLIEKYSIKPEESIFIDDSKANIEAAKKLNFNAILFDSSTDLREELKEYNVII